MEHATEFASMIAGAGSMFVFLCVFSTLYVIYTRLRYGAPLN
jgi:hypothetical protein